MSTVSTYRILTSSKFFVNSHVCAPKSSYKFALWWSAILLSSPRPRPHSTGYVYRRRRFLASSSLICSTTIIPRSLARSVNPLLTLLEIVSFRPPVRPSLTVGGAAAANGRAVHRRRGGRKGALRGKNSRALRCSSVRSFCLSVGENVV